MAVKLNKASLTKSSIIPPHLNRQPSYSIRQDGPRSLPGDATTVLANVASRTASPGRKSAHSSPMPSPTSESGRRTSWEDCSAKRDGYISFPDFDDLQRERSMKAS